MINTLLLPELREMLAEQNAAELHEFCTALHPARTAEFMEGLTDDEKWAVLRHADPPTRVQIFSFFEHDRQVAIIESQPRAEIAALIAEMAPDDRVDVLNGVAEPIHQELLPLLPAEERRDILRLSSYPEGTAGAVMTTDMACLAENLTVRQALDELSHQAAELETIYYLYVVDDDRHLRGVVSTRQLVSAIRKPDTKLGDLMETQLVAVHVLDDQEEMANKVAKYDLLAIPVIDDERKMVGIITHDDVIDIVREEAAEDVQRIAGVAPLEDSYLKTNVFVLTWKRGVWLTILFLAALFTASALRSYEERLVAWPWLVLFIPLVMSSGGNSGNQSATLIITALASGELTLRDWFRVVWREVRVGLMLGGFLGLLGLLLTWLLTLNLPPEQLDPRDRGVHVLVVPATLVLVVMCGAVSGSLLPLLFKRLGWDPALMSNPFVAGISDIAAIVIYMNVAWLLLSWLT